jgi:hypothetical protein
LRGGPKIRQEGRGRVCQVAREEGEGGMMDWVKRRLQQEDELRQHKERLHSGTPLLWKGLCQALQDSLNEYSSTTRYGRFESDAQSDVFSARYLEDTPTNRKYTEEKKVSVVIDSTGSIRAEYEGKRHKELSYGPRKLTLGLGNGRVCLEDENGEFDSKDAAAYFLDPFLFPELAHLSPLPRTKGVGDQGQIENRK